MGQALLADAALAGDQHGGVDPGDPVRQLEHLLHRGAAGDQTGARRRHAVGPCQLQLVDPELALGVLQRLRGLRERGVEALLVVERQHAVHRVAPVVARPADHVAHRVAASAAAILDAVDLPPVRAAQVAAREAALGPAHGGVGPAEVEQVLLGLVRVVPHRLRERRARVAADDRFGHDQALELVDPAARDPPLVLVVPRKRRLHRLRRSPAVGVAELCEDAARAGHAERLDHRVAQEAKREGIHDQRALSREPHDAAGGFEVEQIAEVEVVESHLNMRISSLKMRDANLV